MCACVCVCVFACKRRNFGTVQLRWPYATFAHTPFCSGMGHKQTRGSSFGFGFVPRRSQTHFAHPQSTRQSILIIMIIITSRVRFRPSRGIWNSVHAFESLACQCVTCLSAFTFRVLLLLLETDQEE